MDATFAFSFALPILAFVAWLSIQFPFLRPAMTVTFAIVFLFFGLSVPPPAPLQPNAQPQVQPAIPLPPPGNP